VIDADHVRLGRIAGKLAGARALPFELMAFGVEEHKFTLGAPLSESAVAEFEERHEIVLPRSTGCSSPSWAAAAGRAITCRASASPAARDAGRGT